MVKHTIIIGLLSMVSACATAPPIVQIEYKTVEIPVPYAPKPPVVDKPVLDVTTLTPAQKEDLGELSKSYKISLIQVENYADDLEKIIKKYDDLSKANTMVPMINPLDESKK